ncbi:MAG: DUF2029 domain-containing protein [Actinobacteria bacterium]|nr:DUF2029 domain-containing protein [Actinomycetota bacterium]
MSAWRAGLAGGLAALFVALSVAAAAPTRAVVDPPPAAALTAVQDLVDQLSVGAGSIRLGRPIAPKRRPASLSASEAKAIATDAPRARAWLDDRPVRRVTATYDAEKSRWTVSFITRADGPTAAEKTEAETILFLLPFLAFRRLWSMRTLDLVALASFGVSLIWFNRGEIFVSVPLQYPPLVYFALRLAWLGTRGPRSRPTLLVPVTSAQALDGAPLAEPPRPAARPRAVSWAPTWLLVTVLVVVASVRLGLNAFDSNVIDVGYAGVIGADRIEHGTTPYGTFPNDCGRCDTYGPLNYIAYVPFEALKPWRGRWDDLPAAHGAAVLFDTLALAGMFVLGWLLNGPRLAVALALAWAAFPFTAYALESNSNDSLVAATLVWGLVLVRRPLGRGAMLGLALATKFAPAILIPLWFRHPFPGGPRKRAPLLVVAGMGLATAATGWVLLLDGLDGVTAFWSRTLGYQFGRESPFSIWGQFPGLAPVKFAVAALVAVAAIAALRWPRRLDVFQFVCLSGALMIGIQLLATHWFYLYIPWFAPFALVALVPEWVAERPAGTAVVDAARIPAVA